LIKDEIKIYEDDHNDVYTKMCKMYLIKNIMSFSCYYFDKLNDPYDYKSYQEMVYYENMFEEFIYNLNRDLH
jgi:L-rhamnose mutarotase